MSKSEQLKNLKGKQFKSAKTGKFTSKKANEETPAEVYAMKKTTLAEDIVNVLRRLKKSKINNTTAAQDFNRIAGELIGALNK